MHFWTLIYVAALFYILYLIYRWTSPSKWGQQKPWGVETFFVKYIFFSSLPIPLVVYISELIGDLHRRLSQSPEGFTALQHERQAWRTQLDAAQATISNLERENQRLERINTKSSILIERTIIAAQNLLPQTPQQQRVRPATMSNRVNNNMVGQEKRGQQISTWPRTLPSKPRNTKVKTKDPWEIEPPPPPLVSDSPSSRNSSTNTSPTPVTPNGLSEWSPRSRKGNRTSVFSVFPIQGGEEGHETTTSTASGLAIGNMGLKSGMGFPVVVVDQEDAMLERGSDSDFEHVKNII